MLFPMHLCVLLCIYLIKWERVNDRCPQSVIFLLPFQKHSFLFLSLRIGINSCTCLWPLVGSFPKWLRSCLCCRTLSVFPVVENPLTPIFPWIIWAWRKQRVDLKPLGGTHFREACGLGSPRARIWLPRPFGVSLCLNPLLLSGGCTQTNRKRPFEMVRVKDREEGASVGITKTRFLMGTKAEWTPSPLSFQGHSCFGSEKLSPCVMDDGMVHACLLGERKHCRVMSSWTLLSAPLTLLYVCGNHLPGSALTGCGLSDEINILP